MLDVKMLAAGSPLGDDNKMLATYCPLVYLHPDETSMPSSIEWMLEHTRLRNGDGAIVLNPVSSVAQLMSMNPQENWVLELLSEADRAGQGPAAPVYGTVRPVTQGGVTFAYDLNYWYFYPFNGNIFDLEKAKAILGAVVAAGTIGAFLFPPYGYLAVAAAGFALAYVNSVDGVQMHESDWETVVVRIDANTGDILGVYFSAHAGEVGWKFQEVSMASDSRNGYRLQGRRPLVYAARESHANYPFVGEIERLGGFANDNTDMGLLWDPLDHATPRNPMGRLINIGHDIGNPPLGCEWIRYPGLWGKVGGGGGVYVEWFGSDLQEYADGKTGPAQRSSWVTGESQGPTNWASGAKPLPLQAASGAMALAEYKGFLCAVYTQGISGQVVCAVYNGRNWTQPAVPGLDYLGNNASITMVTFQDTLHTFFRVSTDLEWAQLQIDDDSGQTKGWAYTPFPVPLANPPATGDLSCTSLGDDTLYLAFVNHGALVFYGYDGTTWTDLTKLYPIPGGDVADGPIAVAGYADNVWLVYASGGGLRQARFTPGSGWTDVTPTAPARQVGPFGVALEVFGGYLYLVYADPSGKLFWTRRTASGDWLLDEGNADFPVAGETCAGRFGLAVCPNPRFLGLLFPGANPLQGTLYLTDILSE